MGSRFVIEVDGHSVAIQQPFTAREVLRLGGILGRGIVIRIDGGRASRFDPSAPVAFREPARPAFRTFRGAAHRLHVDGLLWDWGLPSISEEDVRRIAGIATDVSIRVDGTTSILAPSERIDLTVVPPPRLRIRRGSEPGWSRRTRRRDGSPAASGRSSDCDSSTTSKS